MRIISISDKESSKQQELKKKFRDLLISLVKKIRIGIMFVRVRERN